MAQGFRSVLIAFVLVGLFTICMITAGINLANQSNLNQSVGNDSTMGGLYSDLSTKLNETQAESEEQKKGFIQDLNDVGLIGAAFLYLGAIGRAIISFGSMFVIISGFIITVFGEVLIPSAIVIGVIGGIILITLVLYGWRLLKTGE